MSKYNKHTQTDNIEHVTEYKNDVLDFQQENIIEDYLHSNSLQEFLKELNISAKFSRKQKIKIKKHVLDKVDGILK